MSLRYQKSVLRRWIRGAKADRETSCSSALIGARAGLWRTDRSSFANILVKWFAHEDRVFGSVPEELECKAWTDCDAQARYRSWKRRLWMSALPPIADMWSARALRFVPGADIR